MADTPQPAASGAIVEQVSDLVAVFTRAGTCTSLNRAGRRMLRVALDEPLPRLELEDLVAPEEIERFRAAVDVLEVDGTWTGTLTLRTPTGGEVPTRTTLLTVPLGDGAPAIAWIAKDTTTEREVIRSLRQRAFYDPLTGLAHRSLFRDRLSLLLRRQGRAGVGVLLLTPDRFKEHATRLEQGAADALRKAIALRVPTALDNGQSLHRWSDDDFIVLAEEVDDEESLVSLARVLHACFDEPFELGSNSVFLTASIGATLGRPGSDTDDDVIRQVETAGHRARAEGDCIQLFDEDLRDAALRHAEIEDALRGAAGRGELELYFQPEISLHTGQIIAAEALLRWNHPSWGQVAPGDFIPVAESSNLVLELGSWVLHEALRHCSAWHRAFPDRAVTVGVNISGKQFALDDFPDQVDDALVATRAPADAVCLEITETVLLDDAEATVRKLHELKAIGVQLAIDDFGTGYSSLSYLRRFPVDILKVDQSFVRGLGHDPEDSAIVQAVVHMGQALRMTTLAEGVETPHHVIELRELRCDIAQGYHYARPMPADRFFRLLSAGDAWADVSAD